MNTQTLEAAGQDLEAVMQSRAINSLRAHKDKWSINAAANKSRVINQVSKLWRDANHKTGVLIAAGPSLSQSIDEIKALDREQHEIVCVDMAAKYLLDNGIIPDYVICSDSSKEISKTLAINEKLNLLLNVVVDPETAKDWKGPIYWFTMMSNVFDKDLMEFMQESHSRLSGVTSFLVPGGNVSSLGLSFLLSVRAVPKVLLFGHDFCWKDESCFYCGGIQSELAKKRLDSEKNSGTILTMKDTKGNEVRTNASLLYFANWYRDIMKRFPDVVVNHTPTTILA